MQRIREVTLELQLTAYEFAKHTSMSEVGIAKILNRKVKNPNETSVKTMMHFLHEHHRINIDWLLHGNGLMKDISIPKSGDFTSYTASSKKKKLDEVAIFVAHHEDELMENPVFKSIVERRGYQMVVKKLRDVEEG